MRILCVIDSLGSGGAQRQILSLAEMLKERNYDICLLAYYQDDFFKDKFDELNIPLHFVLEGRPIHRIFKVRKFIRNGDYDVVISFLETPDFLNNFSSIGGKKWKVITSERSAKKSTFQSRKGKLYAWFQRYSDLLVCNSYNAKAMWEKYYPQYKDKLVVVYNPVILPKINSEYEPRKYGKLHIVVAASFQYMKNPIGLINSLALLSLDERKKIVIDWYGNAEVIKGDTRAYDESEKKIIENCLQDIIHLHKPTKDIANIMNKADMVALFSELEGLPNAICEGMMLSKPILMSRVSDYSILVDKTNGFLCDWDDVVSIKEALVSAISLSTEQLITMGEKSKEKAVVLFSPEFVVTQWINLF